MAPRPKRDGKEKPWLPLQPGACSRPCCYTELTLGQTGKCLSLPGPRVTAEPGPACTRGAAPRAAHRRSVLLRAPLRSSSAPAPRNLPSPCPGAARSSPARGRGRAPGARPQVSPRRRQDSAPAPPGIDQGNVLHVSHTSRRGSFTIRIRILWEMRVSQHLATWKANNGNYSSRKGEEIYLCTRIFSPK